MSDMVARPVMESQGLALTRIRTLVRHVDSGEAHLVPGRSVGFANICGASSSPQTHNRRIVVKSVPEGAPTHDNFEVVTEALPPLNDGQMLLRTRWASVDPYMRTIEGMGNPKMIGQTMVGGTVSEVLESRASGWSVGDLVVGYYGWQEYVIASSTDVQWHNKDIPIQKWDPNQGPASTAVGILGMTGYTAYFGLLEVGKPRSGETVVVSAASGAVGQVVGQLAKLQGCRVVGIAGGARKCAYCVEELGFDACVDYKAPNLPKALAEATPSGIDVYFENVGGDVLEAVIPLLNPGCRVPICGFVSQYNDMTHATPMQRLQEAGLKRMSRKGGTEGFRFFFWSEPAFLPKTGEALQKLSDWIKHGKIKYRESVSQGLDSIIDAFAGVLRGDNFGKAVIKVA